jgi:uncharacterized membrane protein YeiH
MIDLYFFDLLGVFAFALFGAYVALKKKFDLFGIFACSMLNGLGGGTIREVILGNIPSYFNNYDYIYVVIAGMSTAILLFKKFHLFQSFFLFIDAVGLVTFAFLGAQRAFEYNLSGLGIVIFAVISSSGGGVLRDLCLREKPYIFIKDFYASVAVILGIIFALFRPQMSDPSNAVSLMMAMLLLRVLAVQKKWKLWSMN